MCGVCGCGDVSGGREHGHPHDDDHVHDHDHEHGHRHEHAGGRRLRLEMDLLAENDRLAERNRGWLDSRNVLALNLIGSPGAGKTTLLERTLLRLRGEVAAAVLEGDQATDRDASRIRATGCPVRQINTGTGCHLDARMIFEAARELEPPPGALLLIENVGNLVCPSLFDLGERAKVVVMSVTEGADKPLKYPHIFRAAEILVLTKIDLLPHLDFDVDECVRDARSIRPDLRVFQLSATRGDGLESWCAWLRDQVRAGSEASATEVSSP